MSDRFARLMAQANARYAAPRSLDDLIDEANGADAPKLAAEVVRLVGKLGPDGLAGLGSDVLRSMLTTLRGAPEASDAPAPEPAPMARRAPQRARQAQTSVDDLYAYTERRNAPARAQTIARDPVTGRLVIR